VKRCIYKQSNCLMCDDYLVNFDGKCAFKTSSGNCIVDEDAICPKCNNNMYYEKDRWHCECGYTKDLR